MPKSGKNGNKIIFQNKTTICLCSYTPYVQEILNQILVLHSIQIWDFSHVVANSKRKKWLIDYLNQAEEIGIYESYNPNWMELKLKYLIEVKMLYIVQYQTRIND